MLPFQKTLALQVPEEGKLLFAAFLLFILTLLVGTVPVHIIEFYTNRSKKQSRQSLLSTSKRSIFTQEQIQAFLAQLGGGVLLYTALIHMLPEIRENYEAYLNATTLKVGYLSKPNVEAKGDSLVLPLVDLCACGGFFGIFFVEEIMHTLFPASHSHDSDNQELRSIGKYSRQLDDSELEQKQLKCSSQSVCSRITDAFLLILAFSCHSIFDGISIGVQTGSRIWTVLIAILSHKLLISFILSVQIFEQSQDGSNQSNRKAARAILGFFMVLFSAMSPIGILVVLLMSSSASANGEEQLHIIILASISAGTIIYICFLEIIQKTKMKQNICGLVQWIALLLGFALMHLIASFFPE